jgi:hypothetical protein
MLLLTKKIFVCTEMNIRFFQLKKLVITYQICYTNLSKINIYLRPEDKIFVQLFWKFCGKCKTKRASSHGLTGRVELCRRQKAHIKVNTLIWSNDCEYMLFIDQEKRNYLLTRKRKENRNDTEDNNSSALANPPLLLNQRSRFR